MSSQKFLELQKQLCEKKQQLVALTHEVALLESEIEDNYRCINFTWGTDNQGDCWRECKVPWRKIPEGVAGWSCLLTCKDANCVERKKP